MTGRLPQNIEAEQSVLGSLLIDTRAIERVASFLQAGRLLSSGQRRDLSRDAARCSSAIAQPTSSRSPTTFRARDGSTIPVAPPTSRRWQRSSRPRSTSNTTPASSNVSVCCAGWSRPAHAFRRIGYDERLEADEALENAEKVLFEISHSRLTRDFEPISKILGEVYEKLDHIHSHDSEITGVTTGFVDLDRLTSGMQRSDLLILAGRPSMGKTALALNIAHSVAVKAHLPVGIFSIEMSAEQLAQRLISIQAQVESQRLRNGRMSETDWDRLVQAVGRALGGADLRGRHARPLHPRNAYARPDDFIANRAWGSSSSTICS